MTMVKLPSKKELLEKISEDLKDKSEEELWQKAIDAKLQAVDDYTLEEIEKSQDEIGYELIAWVEGYQQAVKDLSGK